MSSPTPAQSIEQELIQRIRRAANRAQMQIRKVDVRTLAGLQRPNLRRIALIGVAGQSPMLLLLLIAAQRAPVRSAAPPTEAAAPPPAEAAAAPPAEAALAPGEQVVPGQVEPGQVEPGQVEPGQPDPGQPDPGQMEAAPVAEAAPAEPPPAASCARGSLCDPIEMAFPFEHRGSTRASEERRYASYSCAPEISQGGPEIWFTFTLSHNAHWFAAIDEVAADGVDIDLNLLAADGATCLHRDDARIEALLAPGTYLLALDTSAKEGIEQPGPYHLTADATPVAALPTDPL